jgi:hypothetical protein
MYVALCESRPHIQLFDVANLAARNEMYNHTRETKVWRAARGGVTPQSLSWFRATHTTHPTVILLAARSHARAPLPIPPMLAPPVSPRPSTVRPAPPSAATTRAVLGGAPLSSWKPRRRPAVVRAKGKGEASFTDQILDYIEGTRPCAEDSYMFSFGCCLNGPFSESA